MTWMVPFFIAGMSIYAPGGFENIDDPLFDTSVNVGIEWFGLIETSATVQTFMSYEEGYSFSPYQSYYFVNVELSKYGFTVGYEHMCMHPIESVGSSRFGANGGHDRMYVEFSTRDIWQ